MIMLKRTPVMRHDAANVCVAILCYVASSYACIRRVSAHAASMLIASPDGKGRDAD